MYEVHTPECLGCGDRATFSMLEEQFFSWQSGTHLQDVFPDWSSEDRERLISGTCPSCWEEMWAEEEDWEDEEAFYTTMELLDPESDLPEYESDWYVD